MKNLLFSLAFLFVSLNLVANPFKAVRANGDTISLFGYAEVKQVTVQKTKVFVTCTNTFSASSNMTMK